jgi:hypothetical protein
VNVSFHCSLSPWRFGGVCQRGNANSAKTHAGKGLGHCHRLPMKPRRATPHRRADSCKRNARSAAGQLEYEMRCVFSFVGLSDPCAGAHPAFNS